MQPRPLVSIIIPAFNAEKTIRNAVDSVLQQTITDLEVIVVDDASTDGTCQVVEGIADSRVRLLRSASNVRQAAARNTGIRHANGRWLAFLDADDEWVPDRLEHLLRASGGTECYIADWFAPCCARSNGRLKPVETPPLPATTSPDAFDITDFLKYDRCVYPMVPRGALDRNNIEFPEWGSGGDWIFLIARLSACGVKGKLVHRVGYLYRVTGSHDGSTLRGIEEQLRVQEFLASDTKLPEEARIRLKSGVPGIRKRLIVAALREGKWSKLAHYASKNPGDVLILPVGVFRFLRRRLRYSRAYRNLGVHENLG